ncbi:alpha/beta fold hydrolase [Streptomyces sp. DSM 44915]|uniref:Alpha/beta fold hydrolase n=1 Tax=Streptomyces chisholmiae TaxID=3075540 RepID=A0ABU2JUF6_9ACTN|nr:alpha/beta fold hydrolase [Streptomyces sp. DSM 44915]MDT0268608.1 alpha/beta fold hydrolase [Streptomyces sp. DSM 44915]
MTEPTHRGLRVPGATLHYEVRGRGPLLLLISGGTGGADSTRSVAEDLAGEYTVVTYDPRGISRSVLDDPAAEQRVAEHAEDACRLLETLSPDEPARVFGASSGAVVALHLLAAHPGRVARVVAHEPPVVRVLPDAADQLAFVERVRRTFHAEGLGPALTVFAAGLLREGEVPPESVALPPGAAERAEATMANLPYFIGRVVPSFMRYRPDIERLRARSDRLVLAGGRDSAGELPHRAAGFLAERLGTALVPFPGGHVGLTTHPAEFAALLRATLADAA